MYKIDKKLTVMFLQLLLINFFLSPFFLFGNIDQDYFSFYHIGRGVSEGMNMYTDFADNKGPVLYFFFAALYKLFESRYMAALVAASTVLDTIALCSIFLISRIWFDFDVRSLLPKRRFVLYLFFALVYKSYSIGTFMGGIYSETLAMPLILSSIYLSESSNLHNNVILARSRLIISGLLAGASVLTRQTFAVFILINGYRFYKNKKITPQFYFLTGLISIWSLVLVYLYLTSSINSAYENTIQFNIDYGKAVGHLRVPSLISNSVLHPSILIGFFAVVNVLLLMVSRRIKLVPEFMLFTVLTTITILGGGIFYFHHYLQFAPTVLFAFLVLYKDRLLLGKTYMILMGIFVTLNYVLFILVGNSNNVPSLDLKREVEKYKYIMVVPFYPEFYINFRKHSPDEYFQSFFILDEFNVNAAKHEEKHKRLTESQLKETLFIFKARNHYDNKLIDSYKSKFSEEFALEEIKLDTNDDYNIQIFKSKIDQ